MNCDKHPNSKSFSPKGRKARCSKCASDAVQRRRHKLKAMGVEYKGGKCERCGYNKCMRSLDFHHLDPSQKEFTFSQKGHTISWERMKAELDKCILVCKNCHGEIHEVL